MGNVISDVNSHFIGQFHRSHRHAESPDDIVQSLRVDSLLEKVCCFVHVRQQDTVDDEALFVFGNNDHLAKLSCKGDRSGQRFFAVFFCGDDLQQRHAMDRIKKMKPANTFRPVCALGHLRHRQRRRIGKQTGTWLNQFIQFFENLFLDIHAFRDCFNDDISVLKSIVRCSWRD